MQRLTYHRPECLNFKNNYYNINIFWQWQWLSHDWTQKHDPERNEQRGRVIMHHNKVSLCQSLFCSNYKNVSVFFIDEFVKYSTSLNNYDFFSGMEVLFRFIFQVQRRKLKIKRIPYPDPLGSSNSSMIIRLWLKHWF